MDERKLNFLIHFSLESLLNKEKKFVNSMEIQRTSLLFTVNL